MQKSFIVLMELINMVNSQFYIVIIFYMKVGMLLFIADAGSVTRSK